MGTFNKLPATSLTSANPISHLKDIADTLVYRTSIVLAG